MTEDEALKLALSCIKSSVEYKRGNATFIEAAEDVEQALAAPVQVFDHVTAARQGLRDAQNRSRQISNLINCGTCGYPLTPEERTSLIERDGVMVKPAPVQEPLQPVWNNLPSNKDVEDAVRIKRLNPLATPPSTPDLQAELDATNRQVEILSDALAESRREVAALKAVQEPVAWRTYIGRGYYIIDSTFEEAQKNYPDREHQPLYTTQPAAQRQWVGLTDEAIWSEYQTLWPFHPAEEPRLAKDIAKFARAIEAAHGITEKGQQ
jgi:hypothetical protein